MHMSTADAEYVRKLIYAGSGNVVGAEKTYLLEARLAPVAKRNGFDSFDKMIGALRLRTVSRLQQEIVEAMTINESYFFRDDYPFKTLRDFVLPELVRKRAAARRLVIWSAAAATGQEAYSIAMVVREHFPQLLAWDLTILGTDLATDVLDRARRGRYSQLEVTRGLPPEMLRRYFARVGDEYEIDSKVRAMVQFKPLNLLGPWAGIPRADVVFLRNVMIYFDQKTKRTILGQVRATLQPDGYLFMGGAESPMGVDPTFELSSMDWAGCYNVRQSFARP